MEYAAAAVQLSDVLRRARHPAVLAALGAHAALAAGLSAVPLFGALGFERAFATAVLTGFTAPLLGWAVARRVPDTEDDDRPALGWGGQLALALFVHGLCLVPAIGAGWAYEQTNQVCDVEAGLLYLLLLPGAGGVYGVACGQWLRSLFGRRGAWLILVLAAAHLSAALYRLYVHPQIWAYDPLLGFWPGSLYDESLSATPALFAQRTLTVLLGLGLCALGGLLRPPASTILRRAGALVGAVVAFGAAAWLSAHRDDLGWGTGYDRINEALSQVVKTEHFVVHLPPGTEPELAEALAREHERWFERLKPFFGKTPAARIDSYVYANAGQKAQLMGAANTKIARPWAREIHLHDVVYPHGSLGHELAHVLAAEWAPGPLHVPARFGIWPQMGLVEGLAVAADWPRDHATVHEKARALLELELLPDLRKTLSWTGFWSQASSRAYTATGSFVRWIHEQRGSLAVAELYRTGSIPAALDQSVDETVSRWEAFLRDEVEVGDETLAWARGRYRRPSIFSRACPHETAELSSKANTLLSVQRFEEAVPVVERLYELYPDPGWPLSLARTAARAGRPELARAWLAKLPDDGQLDLQRRRERLEVEASLAWRSGDFEAARRHFQSALDLAVSYDVERLEVARIEATTKTATTAELVLGYLEGDHPGEEGLGRLIHAAGPQTPLLDYLIARRLAAAGAENLAAARTRSALAGALPAALVGEAHLMLAQQLLQLDRANEAEAVLTELLESADRPAVRAAAEEWRDRARFIQRWPKPPGNATSMEES